MSAVRNKEIAVAELLTQADWRGGMAFDVHAGDHNLIVDAPVKSGGKNDGPKPSYMLMAGLMGCTGMGRCLDPPKNARSP